MEEKRYQRTSVTHVKIVGIRKDVRQRTEAADRLVKITAGGEIDATSKST